MKELIEEFLNDNIVKEGHKYSCKLDSLVFHSESAVCAHFKVAHRHTIEIILKSLCDGIII